SSNSTWTSLSEKLGRWSAICSAFPIMIGQQVFLEIEMGRVQGKAAIITGAARGQGEATARLFAAEGAQVVLIDMLEEDGARVAKEIGEAARFIRADVSSESDWAMVVEETVKFAGRVDILVNNAAITD